MRPPLQGLKVVQLAGIGPVPFAGQVLRSLGADVILIDRPSNDDRYERWHRLIDAGKTRKPVDLKRPGGPAEVVELYKSVDVVLDGMRPGVAERLGVGENALQAVNEWAVYARTTGWGSGTGLRNAPGHDINYLALSGVLYELCEGSGRPTPPHNVIADFAAGALGLVISVLSRLLSRQKSSDAIEVSMTAGSAAFLSMHASIAGSEGSSPLSGVAPFYRTYQCADGGFVAVGAIEPRFYEALLSLTGLSDLCSVADQWKKHAWQSTSNKLEEVFVTRSRDDWASHEGATQACVTPVLSLVESERHDIIEELVDGQLKDGNPAGLLHPGVLARLEER